MPNENTQPWNGTSNPDDGEMLAARTLNDTIGAHGTSNPDDGEMLAARTLNDTIGARMDHDVLTSACTALDRLVQHAQAWTIRRDDPARRTALREALQDAIRATDFLEPPQATAPAQPAWRSHERIVELERRVSALERTANEIRDMASLNPIQRQLLRHLQIQQDVLSRAGLSALYGQELAHTPPSAAARKKSTKKKRGRPAKRKARRR